MDNEVGPIRNDQDEDIGAEQPDRVLSAREVATRAAERTDRIREYLKKRRDRKDVVTTTRTPLGQTVDWVPAEALAPDGKIADPPSEDGMDLSFLKEPAEGREARPAE